MRRVHMFCLFVLIAALTATAQVFPSSSGSCRVTATGLEGCNWISAINIRKIVPSKTTTVPDPSNPAVFTTRFILAPGGLIDSRSIVGGEVLIIGRNNGEIMNEKKSQPDHINVYGGLVMLMPKGEPYLLRNVGKDDVDLLLVEIRK